MPRAHCILGWPLGGTSLNEAIGRVKIPVKVAFQSDNVKCDNFINV